MYCITGDGTNIYIGGSFINADSANIPVNYITYWNQSTNTWNQMLGATSQPGTSGTVRCCTWASPIPGGSAVFIGGEFGYVDGTNQQANFVAGWQSNLWYSLYSNFASPPIHQEQIVTFME